MKQENRFAAEISVVVPVYNAEKYLPTCISSLEKQTEKDIKIVFVDDGSTDGSLEILQKFAKRER